jgi:putative heme-binding domain-containing protein
MPRFLTPVLLALLVAPAAAAEPEPAVRMLVPGFTVEELPVRLPNQNNLRFAPDGSLTALGYDGRVWSLRDSDGDGLEDSATPFWDRPTLRIPLGMTWTHRGLVVSSQGKVSVLSDSDADGNADTETVLASGWPRTDVGSGGVDATAATLDDAGNLYFGLLVADYSNAYRLRKRGELAPAEAEWLRQQGRPVDGDPGEEVSLYDLRSPRGTIQRLDTATGRWSTFATGIRVPVGLAFGPDGGLFGTDQEGETWMPDGNPLDELNHLVEGRNYGFPPRHPRWLPGLVSEPPVVGFGPQHQSACGLVFNSPSSPERPGATPERPLRRSGPGQGVFGPQDWSGDFLVAGQSRGKLWRVEITGTPEGPVGRVHSLARASMLVTDVAVSPKGDLYLCAHSGPPDWGTGPQGPGRIFRIRHTDPEAPQPVRTWAVSPTEVRVAFDRPLDPDVARTAVPDGIRIEFGEHVRAGDRFETLKPPYAVVQQQDATPRGRLGIRSARLADGGKTLVLETLPHPLAVTYALTLTGVRKAGSPGAGFTVDLDYDLTASRDPAWKLPKESPRAAWGRLAAWAPTLRGSSGTDSREVAGEAGDWENGRELFHGGKLQCARCHRIRGEGATVGPDLSNLVHRDRGTLLRDLREPDATLHPDYVTHGATLADGTEMVGFLRSDARGGVRLADVEGRERSLTASEAATLKPTAHSLMPTGLLDGLSAEAVRDLLTYLQHAPTPRERRDVTAALARSPAATPSAKSFRLLLVASKQDHGPGQHDYPAWQKQWSELLGALPGTKVETAWEWPRREQWEAADVVLFYFWNHDWSEARYRELDAYQVRGGGLVLLHSAVIADSDPERLAERIGLSATPSRVKYRHMPFRPRFVDGNPFTADLPDRPYLIDEPYWPMIGDASRVKPFAEVEVDGAVRPLGWTFERGAGRVFTSIPGHYTWTLRDPLWRIVLLRGIAWAGHRDPALLLPMATREAWMRE